MTTEPQPKSTLPSLDALGREFSRAAAREAAQKPGIRSFRLAPALGVIAALAVASLTPPGRAVAERVGEFVGLVDENGSVVVDLGETPQDQHPYRVVAFGEPVPGETCIFLKFEEDPGSGYGSCLAGDVPRDLAKDRLSPFIYSAPERLFPEGATVLQGLAAADVSDVEVLYRDASGDEVSVPVDVSDLDRRRLDAGGFTDEPIRFFVAFLPPEALAGATRDHGAHVPAVEIRALDADGGVLAARSLSNLRDYEEDLER